MRQEIKERIEQIKKGEVPKGYKKTKVGIIPQEWKVEKLERLIEYYDEKRKPIKENERISGIYPYYGASGIIDYVKDYIFDGEYILLGEDGANIITRSSPLAFKVSGKFWVNNHAHVFKPKEASDIEFLINFLESIDYTKYNTSSAQPKLTKDTCNKLLVPFAKEKNEREKIGKTLSTWDTTIEKQEKLIELKKEQKKWLMQKLLDPHPASPLSRGRSKEGVRLKGFEGEVKKTKLKGNIIEISEKNRDNKVTRILSVTNSRGFIEQSEQFDRQVASANLSTYKIVRRNQFGYNPSRINVGSIDWLRNFDEGVLSPIYVIFKTDETKILPDYIFQFIKSPNFYGQMQNLLQGSVRDNLSFDALSEMKLYIPSIEEQRAIAKILITADQEINLLEKELEALKEQKKGLMQLLLTGIVRV